MGSEDRWISEPRIYTEIARSRKEGPIYVIGGPREARLTIHSQQCRAINLVCALREREPRLTGKRIAIVGAGAAGLTAATALRALGVPAGNLTIFEKTASPLHTQRWSYGRFLHPRLFHWPEEGWRNDGADLPIGDWKAGYAADVREQILAGCAALPILFCTDVFDVEADGAGALVTFRHLHFPKDRRAKFDLALVATGFPAEERVEGTFGGTYWHALEGIDELQGEVHVVGDGDGALTEILMMLIDRFGHAAIEKLCEWLPLTDLDHLHTRDLEAQGNPGECANLSEAEVESPVIRLLFDLLARGHRRTVSVHSPAPLSGASFLLNRALVTHLTWGSPPLVRLQPGAPIQRTQVGSLGGSVIWRAGVGGGTGPEYAQARVASKDLLASLEPNGRIGGLEAGLLVGLLDGLRRPMWLPEANRELRTGLSPRDLGWTEPQVEELSPVAMRPSRLAEGLVAIMAATTAALAAAGIEEADVLQLDGERWVGIDLLARAGECHHEELLQKPPKIVPLKNAEEPRPDPPALTTVVQKDDWNRLWFRLPPDPGEARPSRRAVRALVPRDVFLRWAGPESAPEGSSRKRSPRTLPDPEVLRGLDTIAVGNRRANLLLATMYEAIGDWEGTKRAYLRAGRQPGGERLPDVNVAFRRILLRLGGAVARLGEGQPDAVSHAVWLMYAAAASDLVTLSASEALLLELETTPAYLRDVWAPPVRGAMRRSGGISGDRAAPPEWAQPLAEAAFDLGLAERRDEERQGLDRVRVLAAEATSTAELEVPREPLISLSEMGVWLAHSETDRELRQRLEAAG